MESKKKFTKPYQKKVLPKKKFIKGKQKKGPPRNNLNPTNKNRQSKGKSSLKGPPAAQGKGDQAVVDTFVATNNRGPDSRLWATSTSIGATDIVFGQVSTIPTTWDLSNEAIIGYCVSMVSYAIQSGWLESQDTKADYPYWAFTFTYDTLLSTAKGTASEAPKIKVPRVLVDACAALAPKNKVGFPGGFINYNWQINNQFNITPTFQFPTQAAYSYFFGNPNLNGTPLLGFPPMVISQAPSGDDAQTAAFNLYTFLENCDKRYGVYKPFQLIDFNLSNSPLYADSSAFAYASAIYGQGVDGGYPSKILSHQVYIRSPLFSNYAMNVQSINTGFRVQEQYGGDATVQFGMQIYSTHYKDLHNKCYPIFTYVDFYEWATCIALAMCSIVTNNLNANLSKSNFNSGIGFSATEFLLMLRAHTMKFFPFQFMCQSMLPVPAATTDTACMQPFYVDTATATGSSYAVLNLPMFAVENARAWNPVVSQPTINPRTGKVVKANKRWRVPILAQYKDATFDYTKFEFINGDGVLTKLFNEQGPDVSMVDGLYSGTYYQISNVSAVNDLTAKWNDLINSLQANVQLLTGFANTQPPSVLSVAVYCNLVNKSPSDAKRVRRRLYDKPVIPEADSKRKSGEIKVWTQTKSVFKSVNVPWEDKLVVALLSEQIVRSSLWAIQEPMVKPELPVYNPQSITGAIGTSTIRVNNVMATILYQANEPGQLGSPIIFVRRGFIDACSMGTASRFSAAVMELKTLMKKGEGGILGSIVQALGTSFANAAPALIQTAANAASLIPY